MVNNMTDRYRPILLVEDNPLDVDLTIRAFKKKHFINPITIARDGEEVLDYIEKWGNRKAITTDNPVGFKAAQGRRIGSTALLEGAF